jgi:hypothetical protein
VSRRNVHAQGAAKGNIIDELKRRVVRTKRFIRTLGEHVEKVSDVTSSQVAATGIWRTGADSRFERAYCDHEASVDLCGDAARRQLFHRRQDSRKRLDPTRPITFVGIRLAVAEEGCGSASRAIP